MADKSLIITADDFGLSMAVNEAVEEAHRKGVLTCASLIVTGEAAADAVRRARKMPKLGVGLHLALLDAPAASLPSQIPDLVEPGGDLASRPFFTGTRIALDKAVREQARAEMRRQFELFARTGLPMDHMDGHWHFHQHPALMGFLVGGLAQEFGVKAVRVPREPALASWRAAGRRGLVGRVRTSLANTLLWNATRARLARAGIGSNQWFFGLNDGGAVTRERLLGMIANLPGGISEIGMHPASSPPPGPHAPPAHWRVVEELQALTDPEVIAACKAVRLGRFCDFFPDFLSRGERKGPGPQGREGEGVRPGGRNPSSSHRSATGPSFSHWEKER
jgi:hopanoid biosynthesis associated protein HpnK